VLAPEVYDLESKLLSSHVVQIVGLHWLLHLHGLETLLERHDQGSRNWRQGSVLMRSKLLTVGRLSVAHWLNWWLILDG
jgi:hypothetical protein